MSDSQLVLILSTVPDRETGRKIAEHLLNQKLVACVSISSEIESHYEWQGKRESSQEFLLIMKTLDGKFDRLVQEISAVHPYECPEILQIQASHSHPLYKKWVEGFVS